MAQKNRANMLTDIVSNIYNNLVNFITGQNAQERFVNLLDSSPNILSDKDQPDGYVGLGPTSEIFSSYYNQDISRADLITKLAANQAVGFKWYQVNDAVGSTKIILVQADSNVSLYNIGTDLNTGEQGVYDIATDVFTPIAGGGNASITPITAAALAALPSFSTTTIYVVTDAPYKIAIQAETTSQLSQTGTIIDDVYSGVVKYDLASNTFVNGSIYDEDGNIYNGVLPSDVTLGSDCKFNTFNQRCNNALGDNCVYNVFETEARNNILGQGCQYNTFKNGAISLTFGDNLFNTTIEAQTLGADYTASPDYDFLYGNLYPSTIFQSGANKYHRYYDPANDRIVLTLMVAPFTVSYIGGSGGSLSLETDGTPNGDQTLLNLVAGTNITLTDDGLGSVTIDAAGSGGSTKISVVGGGTVVTGTTVNTYSNGVLVPANSRTAGDVVKILVKVIATGGANVKTIRIYQNATNDLAGSPILIGTYIVATNMRTIIIQRTPTIHVANGTGLGSTVLDPTVTSAVNDVINSTALNTTVALDWTAGRYIVASVQLGNGADSGEVEAILID